MGIDINGLKYILNVNKGKNYKKVLTVGRQNITVELDVLRKTLKQNGFEIKSDLAYEYGDDLFHTLGFDIVDSIDYSDYEGANIIWDMNYSIKDEIKGVYDLVFDGGSLEHIFNFPIALRNCMELVKKDGVLIINTPSNNFIGHGFYQFSPELFFRTLNASNGFFIEDMYFIDMCFNKWSVANDPETLNKRIELKSVTPIQLFVTAKKIAYSELYKNYPLQMDYSFAWKENITLSKQLRQPDHRVAPKLKNVIKKLFPKLYNTLIVLNNILIVVLNKRNNYLK